MGRRRTSHCRAAASLREGPGLISVMGGVRRWYTSLPCVFERRAVGGGGGGARGGGLENREIKTKLCRKKREKNMCGQKMSVRVVFAKNNY